MRRDYKYVSNRVSSGLAWGVVAVRPTTSFCHGLRGVRPLEIVRWVSVHESLAEAEAIARAKNLGFFATFPPFLEVEDPLRDFGYQTWSEFEAAVRNVVGVDVMDGGLDCAADEAELENSEIYLAPEVVAQIVDDSTMSFEEKSDRIVEISGYPPLYEVPPFGTDTFREWRLLESLASGERVARLCDEFALAAFAALRVDVVVDQAVAPLR